MKGTRTIGIVGGGQLGRMLTLAAIPLGFRVIVLNPSPHSPAAQVGADEIIGDYYDEAALRQLADQSDYLTIEIEHVDAQTLDKLATSGKPVNPAPQTIQIIQDKLRQKEFLQAANIPVASFYAIDTAQDAKDVLETLGGNMIVKTRHGAYDGRGNMVVHSPAELAEALERFKGAKLYAERLIPFKKELAVMVARSTTGDIRAYPVVETIHERNICLETMAPADVARDTEAEAIRIANQVASRLEGAGMYGIEMFLTDDGTVLVNEIAPRVHNSGHYTMDACRVSQFEQHIRAIASLPLGSTELLAPAAVMVNILGERDGPTRLKGIEDALSLPHTSIHLYGKAPTKIDRKMGHINATGATREEARTRARTARKKIDI